MTLVQIELSPRVVAAMDSEDSPSLVERYEWVESVCRWAERDRRTQFNDTPETLAALERVVASVAEGVAQ